MARVNNRIPEPIYRRRRQKQAPPPATLDMSKVIAATTAIEARKPVPPAGPDLERVKVAVASREHSAATAGVRAPRAVHMTLPAEDAGRRGYIARLNPSCSGFNHGAFLNES